jgi:hypothetical protein
MPKPSAQESYRQLVSARAHDATVDAKWMADTLRAVGKSLTEFNADVGKARKTLKASGFTGKIRAIPPRPVTPE